MNMGAMTWRLLGALIALALLVAVHGCGGDEAAETPAPADATARTVASLRRLVTAGARVWPRRASR